MCRRMPTLCVLLELLCGRRYRSCDGDRISSARKIAGGRVLEERSGGG